MGRKQNKQKVFKIRKKKFEKYHVPDNIIANLCVESPLNMPLQLLVCMTKVVNLADIHE